MSTSDMLAHDVSGAGPLVVLIHGITESRHVWDPFMPELTARYRVLRVDLRGHGASSSHGPYTLASLARDVRVVVELVEDPAAPAVVVGHSLGGVIATAYAKAYPAAGVINIDQSLTLGAMQGVLTPLAPALRSDLFHSTITSMFAESYGLTPAAERARLEELRRPVQEVVLAIWAPMLDHGPLELVELVDEQLAVPSTTPYLIVFGMHPGVGYEEWLAEVIPHAEVEDWGPVGHYPHLVDPQRFLATIDRVVTG